MKNIQRRTSDGTHFFFYTKVTLWRILGDGQHLKCHASTSGVMPVPQVSCKHLRCHASSSGIMLAPQVSCQHLRCLASMAPAHNLTQSNLMATGVSLLLNTQAPSRFVVWATPEPRPAGSLVNGQQKKMVSGGLQTYGISMGLAHYLKGFLIE